jgi:hypothetical protein
VRIQLEYLVREFIPFRERPRLISSPLAVVEFVRGLVNLARVDSLVRIGVHAEHFRECSKDALRLNPPLLVGPLSS